MIVILKTLNKSAMNLKVIVIKIKWDLLGK